MAVHNQALPGLQALAGAFLAEKLAMVRCGHRDRDILRKIGA
jgi:hypothetical protein